MSRFLVGVALIFPAAFSLLPVATGQFTNVTCLSTTTWTYNSRGQNPCLVAAYLQGACLSDPSWSVYPLSNLNSTYANPASDQATLCTCSSVTFSLLSACAYCQGANIPYWSEWTLNCPSSEISNGQYPHDLPVGTAVSAWAYIPVLQSADLWQSGQAESVASTGAAESSAPGGPSATVNPGGSSSSSSSASSSSASASQTSPAKKSSNTGPIVGGVVGGILGLAILGAIAFFLLRYFRSKEQQARAVNGLEANNGGAPYPTDGKVSVPPGSPGEINPLLVNQPPPMRIYDPEDPSTFPTFAPMSPSVGSYPSPPSQASLVPNRSPPPIEL